MTLDTEDAVITWVSRQLPEAHPLTESETERARVALRDHLVPAVTARAGLGVGADDPRLGTAAGRGARRRPTPESAAAGCQGRSSRLRAAGLPRRGARQLVFAGVGAAGAAILAVALGSTGSSVISPTAARAATPRVLMARAQRALEGTSGSILEYDLAIGKSSGQTEHTHWTQDASNGDSVSVTSQAGGPPVVQGTEDGTLEFYDAATNTIERVSNPTPAEVDTQSPYQGYKSNMDQPGARVDEHATYAGKPAIEISYPMATSDSRELSGTTVMYLQPGTYLPLEWRQTATSTDASGHSSTVVSSAAWSDYRTVPARSAASSLTAQHPSARVVELDYRAWSIALEAQYR